MRDRLNSRWVDDPDRPGYDKRDSSQIQTKIVVNVDTLFNVSAYKPGDFKQFYSDPRTRAEYLQWAPLLLTAENWHAKQRKGKKKK